jgi:hypothetical protein
MVNVYPARTFFKAVTSYGEALPIETGSERAVKQSDSYRVHDVIPQLFVSVLPKYVFQSVQVLVVG